jgi:hypothetical protein
MIPRYRHLKEFFMQKRSILVASTLIYLGMMHNNYGTEVLSRPSSQTDLASLHDQGPFEVNRNGKPIRLTSEAEARFDELFKAFEHFLSHPIIAKKIPRSPRPASPERTSEFSK